MIGFILDLITGNWQWIGGALLAFAAAIGLRRSGRTAERLKTQQKDAQNARNLEDEADAARRRAAADKRPVDQRLRELDGFRDE